MEDNRMNLNKEKFVDKKDFKKVLLLKELISLKVILIILGKR